MAIVALGKLGSCELSPGSDLDLVFVYDHAPDAEESDGKKPLAPGTWYARLCQRLISAITAPTAEGRLYEIDMRLRPSGNAGPTASRLDGFEQYYRDSAWTWEFMALTRARVVAATSPELATRIGTAITEILTTPRDADRLVIDAADMRARIDKEHGTDARWNVKHRRGGLVDIEFIAQYLQLRHAPVDPGLLAVNTAEALRKLADGGVIDVAVANELISALELCWRLQDALRLMVSGTLDEATAPASMKAALARAAGLESFDDLVGAVDRAADRAYSLFREIIDEPAADARSRLPQA